MLRERGLVTIAVFGYPNIHCGGHGDIICRLVSY